MNEKPLCEAPDGETVRLNDGFDDDDYYEDEGDDEYECVICGGDGYIENPDPMWYGFDVAEIPCDSCGGSGLRKDQTYW